MNAAQFRKERYGLSFIIGAALLSILPFPLGAYAVSVTAPKISATPASVNFSSVKLGGSSLKPVTIKNTGSANLAIVVGDITFTGTDPSQFSQTNDCSAPLLPKGTCTVSVTFAPTLIPYGNKSATLNIPSNDPKNPTVTVKLSGQVPPPAISATPASVNLGSVKLGASSAPKVITVKNTGKSDLIINSVNTTGTDGDEFSQTNNCGTIQSGGSCLVNVSFTPNLPYAKKTGILAIASNDPKKPTATVKLSGQAPPPVISASPMSVNLTAEALDIPSAAAKVTIKNNGLSDLNISPVTITGTDTSLFAATDTCSSLLTSGESCTVDVTFTPDTTGIKSATLNIPSDDPKKPLVTVELTGNIRNFTTADLAGIWNGSMLATGAGRQVWWQITYTVKPDGSFTGKAVDSSGTPLPYASGKLSITPNGQIWEPNFDMLCDMDAGKTVLSCTGNKKLNNNVYTFINVFTKQGDSYALTDLKGTWSGNVLSAGSGTNSWTRITYYIKDDGSFTGTAVDSNGNTGSPSGNFGLTSKGILTYLGEPLQCNMDEGKTVIACTASADPLMVNIQIFTKSGATYTAADLAGTWTVNSLATGTDAPCWDRVTVTVKPDGTYTSQATFYDGKTNKKNTKTISGTLQISTDGLKFTTVNDTSFLCQVDANETVMGCTATWNDGSTALDVATRELK